MKADPYGTLAEQKRAGVGYRRPSEIPKHDKRRCHCCSAGRQKKFSGGWLCTMICYSVDKNGRCSGFAPIKEVWR